MAEFYHEVLWQGVGELSEPYILWNNSVPTDELTEIGGGGRREYLPFGMQHPRLSLGLCGLVEETLAAPLGGKKILVETILSSSYLYIPKFFP